MLRPMPFKMPSAQPSIAAFALAALLALPAVVNADTPASQPSAGPSTSQPVATADSLLQRVVVIGASASFGFGAVVKIDQPATDKRPAWRKSIPVNFGDVIDAAINQPHDPVVTHANLSFFANPMEIGPQLLERALARKPTLLVGLDFLFWYGYGFGNREGKPIASEDQRLELLDEGLKLLEGVACPVIVGDFSDMSAAVGGMLSPQQMPAPETLIRLNAHLREWAAKHPTVTIAPLADICTKMTADKGFSIADNHWPAGSAAKLLQSDELHPTVEGLVALSQLIAQSLAARPLGGAAPLEPASFSHDLAKILSTLHGRAEKKDAEHKSAATR